MTMLLFYYLFISLSYFFSVHCSSITSPSIPVTLTEDNTAFYRKRTIDNAEIQEEKSVKKSPLNKSNSSDKGSHKIYFATTSLGIKIQEQNNLLSSIDTLSDLNTKNLQGETLLHLAVKKNNTHAIEQLLHKGVNIYVQDNRNQTALHYAVGYKQINIIKLLLQHAAEQYQFDSLENFLEIKDFDGATALLHAVQQDQTHIAKLLIKFGANIFTTNKHEHTLLHFIQDPELAEFLIDLGLDVNYQGRFKHTPLHFARNEEVTQILIDHGAKVNALTTEENTPLHFANTTAVAQILVSAGAILNFQNIYGCTPLYYAVKNYNVKRCRFLLENNATLAEEKTGNIIDILQVYFLSNAGYIQENFKHFCREQKLLKDCFFIDQAYPNMLQEECIYDELRFKCHENTTNLMGAEQMSKIKNLYLIRMSQVTRQISMTPEQREEYNALIQKFNESLKISIPEEEFNRLKELHNRFMSNNKVDSADCLYEDITKK